MHACAVSFRRVRYECAGVFKLLADRLVWEDVMDAVKVHVAGAPPISTRFRQAHASSDVMRV